MPERHETRRLVGTGVGAVLAAVAATTVAAALARAVGVDFAIADGDETIPVSGIAVVTGVFSVIGLLLAAAFRRWSSRPARRFTVSAVSLTAVSLVPPFLVGAGAATAMSLVGLHLLAAAVMIPSLARSLARVG
ncbi:hypothetical protein EFK50_20455 [Nocardioides marmoriginsengisoli]|uniref:Uncharacterized protein n=1 Tax=Nocardioides marmoriginsengisoli TaxID=661483 RepID=A0A3N0CCH0_9ACTN|nr:DUF6069 family protein [Nocardioides marmoriginsengisoli]RNL60683.1 hypothetical protein EFK50_20455 [Nocardioides marmoriginsengisoli]